MVDFINQAAEKIPGRKPLSKGVKILRAGIILVIVFLCVKYVLPWLWEEIVNSRTSGIIGPM
jgi:hypothetical protein